MWNRPIKCVSLKRHQCNLNPLTESSVSILSPRNSPFWSGKLSVMAECRWRYWAEVGRLSPLQSLLPPGPSSQIYLLHSPGRSLGALTAAFYLLIYSLFLLRRKIHLSLSHSFEFSFLISTLKCVNAHDKMLHKDPTSDAIRLNIL